MRKLLLSILFSFCFLVTGSAYAGSKYLYRKNANWVKIHKANPKKIPIGNLLHPISEHLTAEVLESMLLTVKLNKRYILKKQIEDVQVFNSWEARWLANLAVEGLKQADKDHVVNFAVVHKRPLFVMQNDHISIGNIWVDPEGLHIQFNKLYAKLHGDYESSANRNKLIKKAKSLRLSLAAGEGQKLSNFSSKEIIFDLGHDFMASANQIRTEQELKAAEKMAGKERKRLVKKAKRQSTPAQPVAVAPASQKTVLLRLQELKKLKQNKLISEQEYQTLRKKILAEL